VPSSNAWTFKHRWAYTKHRDTWYALLRSKLGPLKNPMTVRVYARITCHRQKLLDYGNYVGGAKPIPDGLKNLGYLRDDSPEWFTCEYVQHKTAKINQRTTIELSDEPLPPTTKEIP